MAVCMYGWELTDRYREPYAQPQGLLDSVSPILGKHPATLQATWHSEGCKSARHIVGPPSVQGFCEIWKFASCLL